MFISACLLLSGERKLIDFRNELNKPFLIYIICFTISRILNTGISSGAGTFFRFFQDYFIYLWIWLYSTKSNKNKKLIEASILLAASVSILYGLFQFFGLDFLNRQSFEDRISGFHKNPYSYAGQLIIFIFFILFKFNKIRFSLSDLLYFPLALFCIFATTERAVIIGVLIGLIIYCVYRVKKTDLVKIFFIIFFPLLLVFALSKKLRSKIKDIFFVPVRWKNNIRLKLWIIAVNLWKKNIWVGIGKFPAVWYKTATEQIQILSHAHNVYLQILVTNGLLGLWSFLYLFFSVLRKAFKSLNTNEYSFCLILILVAYFIEGFFEYFWGDAEVRYLILYFIGFAFSMSGDMHDKKLYNKNTNA